MTMIMIPQRRIAAIDLIDEAIAALRTVHVAMNAPEQIEEEELRSLATVLDDAILKLLPVRDEVNRQHGAAWAAAIRKPLECRAASRGFCVPGTRSINWCYGCRAGPPPGAVQRRPVDHPLGL